MLQDRDRRRLRLEAELADVPVQQRRLQEKGGPTRRRRRGAQATDPSSGKRTQKLELEVASKQDFIRKCEVGQSQTKSNDEYRRYAHQIDTTRNRSDLGTRNCPDGQTEIAAQELAAAQKISTMNGRRWTAKSPTHGQEGKLGQDLAEVESSGTNSRTPWTPRSFPVRPPAGQPWRQHRGRGFGCHLRRVPHEAAAAGLPGRQGAKIVAARCSRILYYTRDMWSPERPAARATARQRNASLPAAADYRAAP